jgi:hypothetical protein
MLIFVFATLPNDFVTSSGLRDHDLMSNARTLFMSFMTSMLSDATAFIIENYKTALEDIDNECNTNLHNNSELSLPLRFFHANQYLVKSVIKSLRTLLPAVDAKALRKKIESGILRYADVGAMRIKSSNEDSAHDLDCNAAQLSNCIFSVVATEIVAAAEQELWRINFGSGRNEEVARVLVEGVVSGNIDNFAEVAFVTPATSFMASTEAENNSFKGTSGDAITAGRIHFFFKKACGFVSSNFSRFFLFRSSLVSGQGCQFILQECLYGRLSTKPLLVDRRSLRLYRLCFYVELILQE